MRSAHSSRLPWTSAWGFSSSHLFSGKPWLEIFGANSRKEQCRSCKLCTIRGKHNEISSLSSRDLNHLHVQCIRAVYAIFQLVTGQVSLVILTVLVAQGLCA